MKLTIDVEPAEFHRLGKNIHQAMSEGAMAGSVTDDPDVLRACIANLVMASGQLFALIGSHAADEAIRRKPVEQN